MKYLVGIREVWVRTVEIEAESDQEARDKVRDLIVAGKDLAEVMFEYSHSQVVQENWSVEEVKQ